tara:strand:- start:5398 stop:7326 length:1929 start_codon:yes stop_codon:yes gene_type:complete
MARDYVKDIQAVEQLNKLLYESKELSLATDAFQTDITKMISKSAVKMRESNQYSKENLTNSKAQAKAGKNIIGVLNAQNKGSKLGTMAAKAKLKLSKMLNFSMDDETKKLYEQYDADQELLKSKKEKTKIDKKQLESLSKMAGSMLSIFGLSGGILAIFTRFNKMTKTIGKNFGALGMTNKEFKNDILAAGAEAASLGQNIEDVVSVSAQLSKNFGFGRNESVGMAQGIMDTSMALGLSNQEGTTLIGNLMQISGLSFDAAKNFSKQTQLLAEAEGVSPQAVLKDIAASSQTIAEFTAMTPDNLAKAAIQATKLGTTLDTVASSMKSVLSFQDSLNSEIEASILLGRDVNLQKARELALAGKADEFAVELTKQVGSQAEFEAMNVLQRQSLAKALGINVEQMAKMVNNQEKVRNLGDVIAKQGGLEKMIGREAMDNMGKIVADLQRVGTELVVSIGPTVSSVVGGFAKFTKFLSESKMLMPAIVGLMGVMAAKSLATAYSQLIIASALSGVGVGSMIIAGLAVSALLAGLGSLPSFQDLPTNQSANITRGQAIADPGESIVHTEVLQNMSKPQGVSQDSLNTAFQGAINMGNNGVSKEDMKTAFVEALQPVINENKMMREQNESLINETRRGPQRTADALLA